MTTLSAPTAPATAAAHRLDVPAGVAALGSAVVSVAVGVTQLLFPQDTDAAIDARTRVLLVATAAVLGALVVVHARLGASARGPWAARVASTGTVLLALGMLSSAVNGVDLAFFPAVAMVANVLWFLGSVGLAVSLSRAGRVARPLAVLLVVVMPATIFLSQLGGGVLAGAYLAVLGWVTLRGSLDSRRA